MLLIKKKLVCLIYTAKIINVFKYRQKIVYLRTNKFSFLRKWRELFEFAENFIKFVGWKMN